MTMPDHIFGMQPVVYIPVVIAAGVFVWVIHFWNEND